MVYMGSKRRIATYILPFLKEHLNGNNYFIDAFCGGCNLIDKLRYPKRVANDYNKYLVALFVYLQKGGELPEFVSKEEYYAVKDNKDAYPDWYVGHVGFNCSRLGKWFDCYVGLNNGRNYQQEHNNNIIKQIQNLKDVVFISTSYENICLPSCSVIYCDPPYKDTRGYKDKFDHDKFWQWCRDMHHKGHRVFVSEYLAPEDFKCIWEMEIKDSLATNTTHIKTEKLFTLCEQEKQSTLFQI